MKSLQADIAVLGAGIVGVCCALALQKSGHQVTLIDRDGVGEGCSKGNAGHFATEQILPLATPGLMWKIPKMLLDPLGPVSIRWSYLHKIAPWLIRFMLNTRSGPFSQGVDALTGLNNAALPAWLTLLEALGEQKQIKADGSLLVFESQKSVLDYEDTHLFLNEQGIKTQSLSGCQVRELEPGLSGNICHGVLFPNTAHTTDPHKLTRVLAEHFIKQGGKLIEQEVEALDMNDEGVEVKLNGASYQVPKLVLATGAWSKHWVQALTKKKVPLDTERGYHLMLPKVDTSLKVPVTSADRRFIMTPMNEGLRLAGTVEFGGLHTSPNMKRAHMLVRHAQVLLPRIDAEVGQTWMGFRPSLPDSLPIIDKVGAKGQVILAFGHQHLGLTQAAVTGELVDALTHNQKPKLDMTPFRHDRFA
ncbi:FAD-dependent oxidoreductase [Marinomonas sp. MED121]|uniref:NAD(P)/FAD-dependent oxidoreductase n=1 Tax=Marinomonas sp. MED121 TaxID=314277 RepID=UPI0002F2FE2E|nr:FAD-dependent oxidoreductase [Marinomonas sp. MED121]